MTNQEVFTKVATHLLTQGKKSQRTNDGDIICAYRGENGLRCAAGCLIPDDEYDPSLEGKNVFEINHLVESFFEIHMGLLTELQNLHDYKAPEYWELSLRDMAYEWGLEWEVPANVTLAYQKEMGFARALL